MAASKKGKSAVKSRVAKKSSVRRQPARGSAKTAAKRTNGSKTGPAKTKVTAPRASESRTGSLTAAVMAREPERKPAKKAEPRPPRPPAVLPIPQSTFIF